jgi:hypothetical protein
MFTELEISLIIGIVLLSCMLTKTFLNWVGFYSKDQFYNYACKEAKSLIEESDRILIIGRANKNKRTKHNSKILRWKSKAIMKLANGIIDNKITK